MKTASVRDLRYRFPEIERRLRAGETLEITKRGHPIARLSPAPDGRASAVVPVPDVLGRLQRIYGDQVVQVTGAELLAWDRDRL
ncbi:MAG TPA: hypothetical protein VNF74_03305 [Terriglobales bacterium]|nr:hypothetical protein [Terriglobales bacterium]